MTRASAVAAALCACCLLVLGESGWPLANVLGSPSAGATSITATAGVSVGHTTVGSASWGSIPTASSSGTPAAGALQESFSLPALGNPAAQNFYSYNSGNVNLVATTYTVTVAQSGVIVGTPSATLKACSVTWTTTCGGTTTTIGTWSGSSGTPTTTTVVATAPGGRLSVQTSITGLVSSLGGTVTVTINTGVTNASPQQIRSAITTNA